MKTNIIYWNMYSVWLAVQAMDITVMLQDPSCFRWLITILANFIGQNFNHICPCIFSWAPPKNSCLIFCQWDHCVGIETKKGSAGAGCSGSSFATALSSVIQQFTVLASLCVPGRTPCYTISIMVPWENFLTFIWQNCGTSISAAVGMSFYCTEIMRS